MATPGRTIAGARSAAWWARVHARHTLLADAAAVFLSAVANGGIGFVFWVLAARLYAPDAVGLGSAAVSAMFLLGNLGRLGLDIALARALPRVESRAQRARMAAAGLLLVALAGAAAAGLFLWQPLFAAETRAPWQANAPAALAFVAVCAGWGIGLVLEQLLLVSRRGPLLLARSLAFSGVRLAALPLLLALPDARYAVFAATGVGVAAALVVTWLPLRDVAAGAWRHAPTGLAELRGALPGEALGNYAAMLVAGLPGWLLPLLVAARLDTRATAYFYTSWMIATLLNTAPAALAAGFFAEGARRGRPSAALVRRVYAYALLTVGPAALLLALAADRILPIFGAGYAAAGTPLLRALLVAALPYTVVQIAFMQLRLQGRLRALGCGATLLAGTALGGAYLLLPMLGLPGAGLAWLVACGLAALTSLFMLRGRP